MADRAHCAGAPQDRHDRIVFEIDGGELRYRDMRKLHGVWLLRDEEQLERHLGALGPDALQVAREGFDQALERRGRLKGVLADQSVIAGLGNLLVDEICWRAAVNPMRPAYRLTGKERRRLYGQMHRVLRASIPVGRVPPRPTWLTGRRDDPGAACPRCGARLARRRIAVSASACSIRKEEEETMTLTRSIAASALVAACFAGSMPYWIALLAVILCLWQFPQIATYLPGLLKT